MKAPSLRSSIRRPQRRGILTTPLIAAVLALALPAPAAAQSPLAPGGWAFFEWFAGPGPVDGGGFLLDATQRTRVRVTDAGFTGDAFDVFLGGGLVAATPTVPGAPPRGCSTATRRGRSRR